jgi:hypothetical protein
MHERGIEADNQAKSETQQCSCAPRQGRFHALLVSVAKYEYCGDDGPHTPEEFVISGQEIDFAQKAGNQKIANEASEPQQGSRAHRFEQA